MAYQVNLVSNSADGFTEATLESVLGECAGSVDPPLRLKTSRDEALELWGSQGLLVTLRPAGSEPFDYLLVDFVERGGWDESPQIEVLARTAEALDLNVLELESRLEYNAREWASVRGRYHSPDPGRRQEARRIELERELEFFERRGLPYTDEEKHILYAATDQTGDAAQQQAAQQIRDKKKHEDRPAVPARGRRYTDAAPRPWWAFWRRHPGDAG